MTPLRISYVVGLLLAAFARHPWTVEALARAPPSAVSAPLPLVQVLGALAPSPIGPGRSRPFRLRTAPLLGGPTWLRVHVQVLVAAASDPPAATPTDPAATATSRVVAFDLVPRNATDPVTLGALLQLRSVEAEVRAMECHPESRKGRSAAPSEDPAATASGAYLAAAQAFCDDYRREGRRLHLLRHNCWSFALALLVELERTRARQEPPEAGPLLM